ncbi:hypothetical protein [Gallionella capsiferriformans]|uniref:hypothetical protein n=1 Tax=Gallionella capsiferriformans TaxID=370405 RepID=UPI0001AB2436|nr:hypothetical protein [Gallionella capsiferriformans]
MVHQIPLIQKFSEMSEEELLQFCSILYEQDGIKALSYEALSKQGALYYHLYRHGVNQKALIIQLDLQEQYSAYKATMPMMRRGRLSQRWTWEHIVKEATLVKETMGMLPPAAWFQDNGQQSLVQAVYYLGRTWEDLRKELNDFEGSNFVASRNGMRWLSHPEAALSNFLYARGIQHKRGERYPDEYSRHSTAKYAFFDLHFLNINGEWIDVEVWGDKPNGHAEAHYKIKREHKEAYNESNANFLGIHFRECFNEEILAGILEPHIGSIDAFQFDKPTDRLIHSTHWSNADELLEFCRHLVTTMPDGQFPCEGWLRKRGKYKNRPGEVYNTLSIYIKTWLGGIRNLRKLLDQSHVSTIEWDKDSAIAAYQKFYDGHGLTPGQARHITRKGGEVSTKLAAEAARIDNAVLKFAGGSVAVNELLGIVIDKTRRWTREAILDGFQSIISEWKMSPIQLLYEHKTGKTKFPEETYKKTSQMVGAINQQFSGVKEVYEILGFEPPSRPRKRRTKRELNELS